jgi:hypothetical protein
MGLDVYDDIGACFGGGWGVCGTGMLMPPC